MNFEITCKKGNFDHFEFFQVIKIQVHGGDFAWLYLAPQVMNISNKGSISRSHGTLESGENI
jgi:hypothetical protein